MDTASPFDEDACDLALPELPENGPQVERRPPSRDADDLGPLRFEGAFIFSGGPSVREDEDAGRRQEIAGWAEDGAALLGLSVTVSEDEVDSVADFAGSGGRSVAPATVEAIEMAARTETIILDPLYTGKALAGLIHHARSGRLRPGQTVVFVHTGGTPVIFDHVDDAGKLRSLPGSAGYA